MALFWDITLPSLAEKFAASISRGLSALVMEASGSSETSVFTRLHDVTSQKTEIVVVTATITSNVIK
jgi:hypothetical protein